MIKKFLSLPIFKQFLIWRLWLIVPVILATYFLPFRTNSEFTTIWNYTDKYSVVENSLVYPWSNFDGVHYMAIASRGYVQEGRFLPLFPALMKSVSQPFTFFIDNSHYGPLSFWSGIILSNIFFIAGLYMLYKLLLLDYKNTFVKKVIFLMLIFPMSFFFVSIYTESLFLFLSTSVLFLARRKQWGLAVLVSMLLVVTRLPGILILVPLLYEYIFNEKNMLRIDIKKVTKSLMFVIVPLPLLAYMYFNLKTWGDPLFFINAHGALGNSREVSSIVFPLVTIYRYIKIFFGISPKQYEFWVAIVEFVSLIVATVGIAFAFLKKIRVSYLLYSLSLLSLPLLSGTLTGFPRYLLVAFPVFIGLSRVVQFDKLSGKIYVLLSLILQILFLALFARGYFIA